MIFVGQIETTTFSNCLAFESKSLVSIRAGTSTQPYSTNDVFLRPSHRSTECGFTAFELPGEDPKRDAFVVQFLQADISAKIFHVNAVMREQGVVG